jgi:hypothetical protein
MKRIGLAILFYFFLVIVCVYSSHRPIQKPLNVSVIIEITGKGYYQYGRDTKVRDDYFSRVTITNHEDSIITFWMMSCTWMDDLLKFNQDSLEFSTANCTKNTPVEVELKPGKSIIFYPVFHDNSKKKVHTVYSDRFHNNNQVRMGFILLKNKSTDSYGKQPDYVRPGNLYWSNPVSLEYYNNGYRIEE